MGDLHPLWTPEIVLLLIETTQRRGNKSLSLRGGVTVLTRTVSVYFPVSQS